MRAYAAVAFCIVWMLSLIAHLAPGSERLIIRETATPTPTEIPSAAILSPAEGQAVQGSLPVVVFTAVQGFASAELSFGYVNNPTGTWFLIAQSIAPLVNEQMASWDTNLITDGIYDLRLIVRLQDGSQQERSVKGVRVRNYSPIETDTPTPLTATATFAPGEAPTLTQTIVPTATPTFTALPTNPAEMTTDAIVGSLGKGTVAVAGIFLLLGIYIVYKKLKSKDHGTS
jgi:hypothetical protein